MVLHMRDHARNGKSAKGRSTGAPLVEQLEDRRMLAAAPGSLAFALSFGHEDRRADGNGIAADSAGNIYVTGTYRDVVNIAGTRYHQIRIPSRDRTNDIFVIKYNPKGKVVWYKSFGSNDSDVGSAIQVQGDAVYVGGTYKGVADFGGTRIASQGVRDVFIAKLSAADGSTQWVEHLGGPNDDYLNAIGVDSNNNLFIAGTVRLSANINPSGGTDVVTTRGVDDTFIERLDARTGKLVWSRVYGESDTLESVESLVPDGKGGVYVGGIFYRTVNFDRNRPGFELTSAGRRDIYFGHLSSGNQWQFLHDIGGGNRTTLGGMVAGPGGDLFMTGSFKGTVNVDPARTNRTLSAIGDKDGFVARYKPNGSLVWARQFGGNGKAIARGIAVDKKGNVYATGDLTDEIDFNPGGKGGVLDTDKGGSAYVVVEGPGTPPFAEPQDDSSDTYIVRYNSRGQFAYVKSTSGEDGSTQGNSIVTGTSGAVYLTGAFYGTVNFNTGKGKAVIEKTVEDSDQTNVFIMKING